MKSKLMLLIMMLMLPILALAAFVNQDTGAYPYSTPTYIPNVNPAPYTFASGVTGEYGLSTAGIGTAVLRVSGTCTGLAAVARGTNDGANWTAINLYPIATGTSAPTAVASISAVGFWKINSMGFTAVELNVTALTTGPCVADFSGSPHGFNGTQF